MCVKCCQCVISRNRHTSINFKESCSNYLTQPMCLRLLREGKHLCWFCLQDLKLEINILTWEETAKN